MSEDVGTLPAMVTPVRDPEGGGGGLVVTPVEYPGPTVPSVSFVVTQPLVIPSTAGLAVGDAGCSQPSTGSVHCSSVPPTIPAVSWPEKSLLFQAVEVDQGQPWSGPSFGGESAGRHLPAASLTPRPGAASHRVGESDAVGGGGGARTSQTCLAKGRLISTRTIHTQAHGHVCCRAPRGVHSG